MCRFAMVLLLAACAAPGYRDPQQSAEMERVINDRNIESRVRMALAADPVTARSDSITVRCERGVVTLVGHVRRPETRARAVNLARACRGVNAVIDRMN